MSVPALLDALSDKRSVCHLHFTVSCFCSFPGPLLPTEWAKGEVAACLRAGRIYEIIPLMGYTSSVSNGLPAWGEGRGYVKKGNWVSSCSAVSWSHQENRVGTWKTIAAFQPPDSLGIFSDFSVRGREEMEPFKSFVHWLIISQFPIYFISLFLSRQLFIVPIGNPRGYVANFAWVPWFTWWISRMMWMAKGNGESLACSIFPGFIND